MDEFILTFLVTGTDATLPLFIYSSLRYNLTPQLNALSSIMLAASFVLCGLAALVIRGWGPSVGGERVQAPPSCSL